MHQGLKNVNGGERERTYRSEVTPVDEVATSSKNIDEVAIVI